MGTEASLKELSETASETEDTVGEEGLRSKSKPMSLKAKLLARSTRKGGLKSRLKIRDADDLNNLDQAEHVGAAMAAARIRRKEDVDAVASYLRIRADHIKAMEAYDLSKLPSRAYTLGFVRAYANYLELDADECVKRFKTEYGVAASTTPSMSFPEVREEVRLPQGSLLVLAVILAVAIYGGWYLSLTADRVVTERVPPVPERLVERADESEASSGQTVVVAADDSAVGGPTLSVEAQSGLGAKNETGQDVSVTLWAGDQPKSQDESLNPPADASTMAVLDANAATGGRSYGQIADTTRIRLRARQKAWLRVEDVDGQVLIQQNLYENDQYFAPEALGLILSVRDAGAFDVILDGTLVGPLGESGQVLPSVSLDPDLISLMGPIEVN